MAGPVKARQLVTERGRNLISLAFAVGSGMEEMPRGWDIKNPDRYNATVLNGLLALALVEMTAPAHDGTGMLYTLHRLREALDQQTNSLFEVEATT